MSSVFDIPIVADDSIPPGMARVNGRLHRLDAVNTASWSGGAVAYATREDAEAGLAREPDREHVWRVRGPGCTLVINARATTLRGPIIDPAIAAMDTLAPGWSLTAQRMADQWAEHERQRIMGMTPPSMRITGI